ncbi:hypothetical protein NB723_002862 [Xanthomonas sacchari]|nr:hypothetical protein [Xanthomonas sacchari]
MRRCAEFPHRAGRCRNRARRRQRIAVGGAARLRAVAPHARLRNRVHRVAARQVLDAGDGLLTRVGEAVVARVGTAQSQCDLHRLARRGRGIVVLTPTLQRDLVASDHATQRRQYQHRVAAAVEALVQHGHIADGQFLRRHVAARLQAGVDQAIVAGIATAQARGHVHALAGAGVLGVVKALQDQRHVVPTDRADQAAAADIGGAVAVVHLGGHAQRAGVDRLGRDVATGLQASREQLVVAGVATAQARGHVHPLADAGVLVVVLALQDQRHVVPAQRADRAVAADVGGAVAVVHLGRHAQGAGVDRLGRDRGGTAARRRGGHVHDIVVGIGAAELCGDHDALVVADVLVDERGLGGDGHIVADDGIAERGVAHLRADPAVVHLAGDVDRHRQRALGDVGIGRAVDQVVAGIVAAERDAGHGDLLVDAGALVGEHRAGRTSEAHVVTAHHAAQGRRPQAGGGGAVVDLALDRAGPQLQRLLADRTDVGTGAGAGQTVTVHAHRAVAGVVHAQAVDGDRLAVADVLAVVVRGGAGDDDRIAVDRTAAGRVADPAQCGSGIAVIGLAGCAGQGDGNGRGDAVKETAARIQHGAAGAGVVLLELRRQTAAGVIERRGGIHQPAAVAGAHRAAACLIDEVAAGRQQHAGLSLRGIARAHRLLQRQVRAGAGQAHVHRAGGGDAGEAIDTADQQVAVVAESQVAALRRDRVHQGTGGGQRHRAAGAQRQCRGGQRAAALDAGTGHVVERQRLRGADAVVQAQAALRGAEIEAAAAHADVVGLLQTTRLHLHAVADGDVERPHRHVVARRIHAQRAHAVEARQHAAAQDRAAAAERERVAAGQGEGHGGCRLIAQRGAGRIETGAGSGGEGGGAVVEVDRAVQAQGSCRVQPHRPGGAGAHIQAGQCVGETQAPSGAGTGDLGGAAHVQRQRGEVEGTVAEGGASAGGDRQFGRRYAAVDSQDALAALQAHGAGASDDVAVEHQVAAVAAAHFQRGRVDLADRRVAEPGAQMQGVGRGHLPDRDLAVAAVGGDMLAEVDGVAGQDHVAGAVAEAAGGDVQGLVEQFEAAAGVEVVVAGDADGAGAVGAADGQVADARQLVQRRRRGEAVGVAQHHVDRRIVRLQAHRRRAEVVEGRRAPVDLVGAQHQHAAAGIEIDRYVAEHDVAAGVDAGAALHGEGGIDVEVPTGVDQAVEDLLAAGVAAIGLEQHAPGAEGHVGVQRHRALPGGQVHVAAIAEDRRVQGQVAAAHVVRVAPDAHVAAIGGQRAADRDAVGAVQGDRAGARGTVAVLGDVVGRQRAGIGAGAMCDQVADAAQEAGVGASALHVDAAGPEHFHRIGRIGEADGAVGVLQTQADIVGHAQAAIAAVQRQVAEGDAIVGHQHHVGVLRLQVPHVYRASAQGTDAGAAALDADGVRVQQQVAHRAVGRAGIGAAAVGELLLAGDFGAAAVAALRATAHGDAAGEPGVAVGPDHRFAAVAAAAGAGVERDAGIGLHVGGVTQRRIVPLPTAADVDGATAGRAAGVQARAAVQA